MRNGEGKEECMSANWFNLYLSLWPLSLRVLIFPNISSCTDIWESEFTSIHINLHSVIRKLYVLATCQRYRLNYTINYCIKKLAIHNEVKTIGHWFLHIKILLPNIYIYIKNLYIYILKIYIYIIFYQNQFHLFLSVADGKRLAT